MDELTVERLKTLKPKLTLFTGIKSEGNIVFTFQDFYDIEASIESTIKAFDQAKSHASITKIPMPEELLKGNWHGIVYCVDTEELTEEEHKQIVAKTISDITNDFSKNNHESVSLRVVKQELVYANERFERFASLVQFRIRDSY